MFRSGNLDFLVIGASICIDFSLSGKIKNEYGNSFYNFRIAPGFNLVVASPYHYQQSVSADFFISLSIIL